MTVRDSFAVQASGPTGMLDVEETRLAIGALVAPMTSNFKAKGGFRAGPTSPGAVTATGTPDGFVHVAPFQLFIQSGRATAPGVYITCIDAIENVNILSTPANPTNPRDDLIVAQQSDTFYGDGNSLFAIRQVVGTPAGVPADPTVTGSPDYVTLARVRVDAAATSIAPGKITDLRTSGHAKSLVGGLYSVALGGILPVASLAERSALTGTYPGFAVWRADGGAGTGTLQVTDGAGAWFTWDGQQSPYTPAITSSGGGAAVGNGTIVGDYIQIGKAVFFRAEWTLGTTSTLGTGFLRISLPTTAAGGTANSEGISGVCLDVSAGEAGYRPLAGRLQTSTTIALITPTGGITNIVPFTWATGDILSVGGCYLQA